MTRTIRTDWAVLGPDNRVLHTFGSRDLAEAWFRQQDGWALGLELVRLRTMKEVHHVAKPRGRVAERNPFHIPPMPHGAELAA